MILLENTTCSNGSSSQVGKKVKGKWLKSLLPKHPAQVLLRLADLHFPSPSVSLQRHPIRGDLIHERLHIDHRPVLPRADRFAQSANRVIILRLNVPAT